MLRTLSVTEVSNYVAGVFDAEEMLHDIPVRGEISGFQIKNNIAYFSLKDSACIINCVAFGADRLIDIKNGDDVLAIGSVRYYAKGGRLNFNVIKLQLYGEGEIYKQFLILKEKLEKEGLFDISHKKELPKSIKKIGVISSSTGAVIHDIIDVSTRRDPSINILLYPAKVQGVGAENTIISGLEYFEATDVDVVIIARGGGSYEDLQCFNAENLARKVYGCNKVIVSAVGHETDFTIIDFVADLRAPTPSAAAELVTKDFVVSKQHILMLKSNLIDAFSSYINCYFVKLKDLEEDLRYSSLDNIQKYKNSILSMANTLGMLKYNAYNERVKKIDSLTKLLDSLNPLKIMMKGYSKIYKNGQNVKTVKELNAGENIEIGFFDGVAKATITDIEV